MNKKILSLMLSMSLLIPCTVNAETSDNKEETNWKTNISVNSSQELLDNFFNKEEYKSKTMYVTKRLNMRPVPNIKSEVIEVLNINTEVNTVAKYEGWTRISVDNGNGEEEQYYLWNEYLSDEKVEINESSNTYTENSEYLGNFKLTAYCSCSKCCGKWAGGGTASGTMPVAGRTVAMAGVPFGTKLLISGNVYTVEDRGTPYGHIDVYFNSHNEALNFGLQYANVYRIG